MKEIEEIIEELGSHDFWEHALILDLLKRAYNTGLQDATDNVALNSTEEYNERKGEYYREYFVDKNSILKLKL